MESLAPNWTLDDDDEMVKDYFVKINRPYTEDTMIDILKNQPDRFSLYWAILALRKIGTKNSIEYLKNVVHYKNMDIQGTSVLTIAKLADGEENEFLGELLLDKEFKQKWYAMAAIFFKANDRPLPYILEYGTKKIKNCKNMLEADGLVITYLARYAPENIECQKLFAKINKNFDSMPPRAQKCLKEEFPQIFGNS